MWTRKRKMKLFKLFSVILPFLKITEVFKKCLHQKYSIVVVFVVKNSNINLMPITHKESKNFRMPSVKMN